MRPSQSNTMQNQRPPDSAAAVERRNMQYGIVHGAFFQMATAFADPYAILPLFIAGFTESRALIGLVISLVQAVGVLPQLSIATHLRRAPGIARPLMLAGIWTRCAVWGLIAAVTLAIPDPGLPSLLLFMLGISIFSLGGGIAVLPLKQVISGTIAPEHRSSFFGWRLFSGGILAALAGLLVKSVLGASRFPWPQNYGILFLLSFTALGIAYAAMSRFQFPEIAPLPDGVRLPLREEVRRIGKEYPILKRLIAVRLLSGGLTLALPFLTLYATSKIGIPLIWIGGFVVAQRMGAIGSNLIWMPIGNRSGTRLVILLGLGCAALSLTIVLLSESVLALTSAFALAGAAMSAMMVGFGGYILELGTHENRPLLFALEGTLILPLYFMPMLGGWLADLWGYRPLLLLGIGLIAASFSVAMTLCEPRHGGTGCGPCATTPQPVP